MALRGIARRAPEAAKLISSVEESVSAGAKMGLPHFWRSVTLFLYKTLMRENVLSWKSKWLLTPALCRCPFFQIQLACRLMK